MITKLVRISLALAVITFGATLMAQVQNGGFETGDFSGWTVSGDTSFIGVCDVNTCPGGFAPYAGTYAAYFGPVGDTATISQNIATTPGTQYTLDFYLAQPTGGTPNYFSVTFGTSTFSLTNFGASFGWSEFDLTTTANSSETALSFTFRNDPDYWFLDNVSISSATGTGTGTTPEPGTFVMFGSGLLAVAGVVRRKLRS